MVYLNGYCYKTKIEGPQINKIKNYSELGGNLVDIVIFHKSDEGLRGIVLKPRNKLEQIPVLETKKH